VSKACCLSWGATGIIVTFFYLRWQLRSGEESPEAIKARVSQLYSELRSQLQSCSYGARSKLIAAPLKELDLDITPRVGWVRDPRLTEPEPISENTTDIAAAFTSSKRRLLIVGEPGSGKTTAAHTLIQHLDETEGDEGVPLLVNLSAWEAQETLEAFRLRNATRWRDDSSPTAPICGQWPTGYSTSLASPAPAGSPARSSTRAVTRSSAGRNLYPGSPAGARRSGRVSGRLRALERSLWPTCGAAP
jgi:hypothetical protein